MKQYEIWWARFPDPVGARPVMLLSRDAAYEYLSKYVVVEITTRIRAIPQEVPLGKREGLPSRCVANFDNLHVMDGQRLKRRMGSLARTREPEVKHALGHALAWPELVALSV
ncbi:MAG: type II toxin-antitoxin system PemK/MazF family toxin [Deltaproteobacteria bacterium]|nr:type II toxin-antitoxin system PemK/MazF family toxin [Deltaproteobacteria bacterium]